MWVQMNQDIYVSHSSGDKLWCTMLKGEFISRVVMKGWLNVTVFVNIRQSLTAVWKIDMKGNYKIWNWVLLEEVASHHEMLNSIGVGWHCQICPLNHHLSSCYFNFSRMLKDPTGASLGSVIIVKTTKWTLKQG